MVSASLLLVEDDREIRALLEEFLSREGFSVQAADSAAAMDRLLSKGFPDLIILDLMLPGEDGLSACRRIRARSKVPILMLTAKTEDIDRILGLEMGADDYLGKPFNPRELLARIRAILRRSGPERPEDISRPSRRKSFAGLTVDLDGRVIEMDGERVVHLTTAEFDLLVCFLEKPRRVLSREQLLDWTRGRGADPFDRTIDVTVSRLRTKLGHCLPDGAHIITTVRNAGYLLTMDVKDV